MNFLEWIGAWSIGEGIFGGTKPQNRMQDDAWWLENMQRYEAAKERLRLEKERKAEIEKQKEPKTLVMQKQEAKRKRKIELIDKLKAKGWKTEKTEEGIKLYKYVD